MYPKNTTKLGRRNISRKLTLVYREVHRAIVIDQSSMRERKRKGVELQACMTRVLYHRIPKGWLVFLLLYGYLSQIRQSGIRAARGEPGNSCSIIYISGDPSGWLAWKMLWDTFDDVELELELGPLWRSAALDLAARDTHSPCFFLLQASIIVHFMLLARSLFQQGWWGFGICLCCSFWDEVLRIRCALASVPSPSRSQFSQVSFVIGGVVLMSFCTKIIKCIPTNHFIWK